MKKLFTLLFLVSLLNTFGQTILKKADKLVEQKKYASAFALLEKKDPDNKKPAIVLKKADIAMDYFVSSIMHQTFAFKDLEEGEDLMEARINDEGQTYALYVLPIQDVLDTLIMQHPKNYKLHKTLGKFYYEVYLKYGENWMMTSDELLKKMYDHSIIAAENGEADFLTYYNIGFYLTGMERYSEAISAYKNSVQLDSTYPTSQYNLAICYLYVDSAQQGTGYAEKAVELYKSPALKADAARVTGVLYKTSGDFNNAHKFLELSNQIQPENYYTLAQLLEVQLTLELNNDAANSAAVFFELDPANPAIVGELMGIYSQQNADTLLFPILNKKIEEYKDDFEVLGTVYFLLARYYIAQNDIAAAKTLLIASRKNFEKVLEDDTPVFKVIDDFLAKYPDTQEK